MDNRNYRTILFFCWCLNAFALFGQDTLILDPMTSRVQDCIVNSRMTIIGFPQSTEISASAWTNRGVPVVNRGLLNFMDIPDNITLIKASLSLYGIPSISNGNHSTSGGSNECLIQRITTEWDEKLVNWNNQPSTTTENQVVLIESVYPLEDYLDIDITSLVEDVLIKKECSFGFMLKLQQEEHYRRMIFASSNHHNLSLHPKLVLIYRTNN